MESLSDKTIESEKHDLGISLDAKDIDTGAQLVSGESVFLDKTEELRIRRKIDKHVLPLMCSAIQFMDKTTLGSSAILGIRTATHLTTNQCIILSLRLGTIFYLGYLVCEYPQNLALQRFPVGKWMSLNIFVWGIALSCHAACTNFAGLFVARLVLGMCEGSITAGFMIVSSMFYTRSEQTVRVGYWFMMNGTAQIVSGFISFGSLHIHTKGFEPWQWFVSMELMVITGFLTVLTAIAFFFIFPDSPTNAWFLTSEERAKAIHRIKGNQTGVENKQFKKEQMIEAIMDPKTWLFALFTVLDDIPNSITNQSQIIVSSFGFSNLHTTLLGCVSGVIEIVTVTTGVKIAAHVPNSIAWVAIVYFIPNILGVFLVNFLPWSDKVGLLFSIWITGRISAHHSLRLGTTGFVLCLAWISQTTAGHTKKVTTNAIMLSAYGLGNAAGPFLWQEKYKPRNRVPWIIIGICWIVCVALLYAIRVLLKARNMARDAEPRDDTYDGVYVTKINEDGKREEVKVDKEFLDLTDMQNRDFRYVL
ncbi:MFS general substrate transporter [Artomyces pyxidatus]|uniref:MFS general substrate transporter n=1 Tax=Artomyces pyxidatus TaxID=48021 RepID=A0ACB8TCP7_9AGAM|nr:MFS general substrate transporter [Artomyces pyxidatus]